VENEVVAQDVPVAGDVRVTTELLERAAELSALDDGLGSVRGRSRGRVVSVSGEAGVGKTALLRRFCAAREPSVRILRGGCEPLFLPRPLGPLLAVTRLELAVSRRRRSAPPSHEL
jgi:predicted ATPase